VVSPVWLTREDPLIPALYAVGIGPLVLAVLSVISHINSATSEGVNDGVGVSDDVALGVLVVVGVGVLISFSL
jgi:hypothetical protein